MQLPRHWLTAGSNDWLWGSGQTYKVIPYEALPRIEGLDGSFAWLDRGPTLEDALAFQEQPRPPFAARVLEAQRAGLDVPSEALRFLQDAALHGRVRSCTSCYLELGSRLVPLPNHDGPERLLRFLLDQQTCCIWYLLLEPGRRHRVVVALPEWVDDPESDELEDLVVPCDVTECAGSFEEFIKRFWIENTLWFARREGTPVPREAERYAAAARDAVARGLVSDASD